MHRFLATATLVSLLPVALAAQGTDAHLQTLRQQTDTLVREMRTISRQDKSVPNDKVISGYLDVIDKFKGDPQTAIDLTPAIDHLRSLVVRFHDRTYASQRPRSTGRALARTIEASGKTASTAQELVSRIIDDLELPTDDEVKMFEPVDMTLDDFLKLGPVRIWLLKHRMDQPKSYRKTTPETIENGIEPVESAVVIEGVARNLKKEVDRDITFDVGAIHCEITPSWTKKHKVTVPANGQRVRVYGWTYYDYFHKDEDKGESGANANRTMVWEIHPVHKVEILGPQRGKKN